MPVNLTELRHFIPARQLAVIRMNANGEEGAHFRAKLSEFSDRVQTMPKVYQQDGLGDRAIVYLHYFRGGHDWYITERDLTGEQLQAFGLASLDGHYPELGYISIAELIGLGVELDLYFEPTPLGEIRAASRLAACA